VGTEIARQQGRRATVEVHEFNLQYNIAQDMVETYGPEQVPIEQERLRKLLPELPEEDREWATASIAEDLPQVAVPAPPPTPRMLEAREIQRKALAFSGTRTEWKAVLQDAHKRIDEMADATDDRSEAADIRWMTRAFDHLEESTDDPFWEFPGDRPNDTPADEPRP
jgi:hypothetical protein